MLGQLSLYDTIQIPAATAAGKPWKVTCPHCGDTATAHGAILSRHKKNWAAPGASEPYFMTCPVTDLEIWDNTVRDYIENVEEPNGLLGKG